MFAHGVTDITTAHGVTDVTTAPGITDVTTANPDQQEFCSDMECLIPAVVIGALLFGVIVATVVLKIRQYYR